jgi:hypothetical protein
MAPKIGAEPRRRHANATDYVAERRSEARRRRRGHEHTGDIKEAAGGDGARGAETVSKIAEKRREGAHQQHR